MIKFPFSSLLQCGNPQGQKSQSTTTVRQSNYNEKVLTGDFKTDGIKAHAS